MKIKENRCHQHLLDNLNTTINIFQKRSYFQKMACRTTFHSNLRVGNPNVPSKMLQLNYFASCMGPKWALLGVFEFSWQKHNYVPFYCSCYGTRYIIISKTHYIMTLEYKKFNWGPCIEHKNGEIAKIGCFYIFFVSFIY